MNKEKIKVFTAFSGYDSQCLALNRLKDYDKNFDYELVGWSEIDKHAILAHDALFPEAKGLNYGDISKVDWKSVPDFDLFTYSSPCFVAGTKVIVKHDLSKSWFKYKDIQDIREGDYVLTHTHQYKKVIETFVSVYRKNLLKIKLYGGRDITTVVCTMNHPFYVYRNGEFQWIQASDLNTETDWIANYSNARRIMPLVINGELVENRVDDYTITKIESITVVENDSCLVYNMEVEDDHSYTANTMFVHNCTDFSSAGLQAGGTEGSGTRSSLLWECKRTIEEKRPKYLLFENVVALLSKKFINVFEKWVKLVNSMGYNSYYQVLNAKDYGIAHNRPRVFMVSVRKDIGFPYTFPGPIDERPHLYEYLQPDSEIDPKYWRTQERKAHYLELNEDAVAKLDNPKNSFAGYDVIPCGVYCHSSDRFNSPPIYDIARCLKAESIESGILYKKDGEWFERLFTQRECFRLMGLTDEEYDRLASVVSLHQQSRMAGNSIVVDVIYHIFRKLFTDIEPDKYTQNVLF